MKSHRSSRSTHTHTIYSMLSFKSWISLWFFASPKIWWQEGFVARSSDIDIVYIYGFFCKKTRGKREDVCLGNLLLRCFSSTDSTTWDSSPCFPSIWENYCLDFIPSIFSKSKHYHGVVFEISHQIQTVNPPCFTDHLGELLFMFFFFPTTKFSQILGLILMIFPIRRDQCTSQKKATCSTECNMASTNLRSTHLHLLYVDVELRNACING